MARSATDIIKELDTAGFSCLPDAGIGDLVSKLGHGGFHFWSEDGLSYYENNISKHQLISSVVEKVLGACKLMHWVRYSGLPDHIECFRSGGPRRQLIIQHWESGGEAIFYSGSHHGVHCSTESKASIRKLHESNREDLLRAGCQPVHKTFPHGCLVIRDGRLYVEHKAGSAITFVFATDDAMTDIPKIMLPALPRLIERLEEIQTERMKINYDVDPYDHSV
ncbi:hypothetical protein B0T11DRAFT_95239 [Plectosphaerella cucumerina]|uniref:Uncharacterized protein n=1 Tax=Plectosphaerella cucumerina TaxID=40658 RepID=A0A8K0X697_9PEZI|nr:hypothetical protein B0T11DRAFT_95239 [Plectosphaerella cucumerina]